MNWLLDRLKEKSTWLALFTFAGLLGMRIEPELREMIINAILAVAAVAAFVFREEVKHAEATPPVELERAETRMAEQIIDSLAVHRGFARYRDPDDVPRDAVTKDES